MPLGKIAVFERGLTYSKADEVAHSRNGVLRANNIDLATKTLDLTEIRYIADTVQVPPAKKVRRNSLLICTASGSRSHLGKVALIDDDYDLAFGGFMGLITAGPSVDARYLYYLLTGPAYQAKLDSLAGGTNINNLKFKEIADFAVPLPPLEEQRRIVAVLDDAFAAIGTATANVEKNLANARDLFEAAFRERFDHVGDEWKTYKLPDVAENWDYLRRPVTKSDRVPGEVPYYGASGQVDSVRDSLFDDDLLLVSEDGANLLMRTYPIAFSISGKSWVNNHAHILKFKDMATQRLVEYYLNSISVVPWVSGMAQPKLNQKALNTIPVPLPPEDERENLVAELDDLAEGIERFEANQEARLAMLAALKQSLLHRVFAGELAPNLPAAIAA